MMCPPVEIAYWVMADIETRRSELYKLLGDLPDVDRPVAAQMLTLEERGGYMLETLVLDLNGTEDVPAYFAFPKIDAGPFPTVLYNHAHGAKYLRGREELLEPRGVLPPYVDALTERGIAVLCFDTWMFGERRGRAESDIFKEMLWGGQVLWGMMIYDSLKAVDYLVDRADVDESRLATLGMSMGSTMAWWLAALDKRIKVCIDICCLTDFEALIETGGLDGHGVYYYVPSLLKYFTAGQINALIAPRAHLGMAGIYDPLTPAIGLDRIDQEVSAAYAEVGAEDRWELMRFRSGHFETAEMRTAALDWLDRWL
jgi:pimeloyl-ACP methyl ester carboxylesterase